ncbi:unnamed protein product [Angiostrongylus costaricensis]|uniref:Uncharacterized protein n=1 Tax=Angiostrongylus costaricensis TaxID=334426 RepID=A0A158PDI7_ANGCS|nr:unnamed protein product [Angiostrongylus costaricensis]
MQTFFFQFPIVEETAQSCRSRTLLLLKRLDVTVNSFLWCERIKSRESEIRNLFAEKRNAMSHIIAPDIASLLAASHDLLRVEQASSARLRKNTRSKVHPLALAERPTDRGGRTSEMIGDIAMEQASAQRGRGGGRGGFHSQPSNQFNQHHGMSREQMTQKEYRRSYDSPGYRERGGGYHRGGHGDRGHADYRGMYYGHDNRY